MLKTKFNEICNKVINELEGGYYHPQMLKDGRIKDKRYSTSGETLFGIDRLNSPDLNKTSFGKEFWNIIDTADAKNKWKWNFFGGTLETKLKNLASEMIFTRFENWVKTYKVSNELIKQIELSDALKFHFIYACWNGNGWFSRFTKSLNTATATGKYTLQELEAKAIQDRIETKNSLIMQGAYKIKKLFNFVLAKANEYQKKNPEISIVIVLLILAALFFIFKKIFKRVRQK